MSFTSDMLRGYGTLINAAGIASMSVSAVTGGTLLSFKDMPQTPDRVVTLTGYQISDEVVEPLSQLGLQVISRGNPNDALDVDDLGDSIFQLIQGMTSQQMGSLWVVQTFRDYSLPLGVDSNQRWTRSDRYTVTANPPITAYRH